MPDPVGAGRVLPADCEAPRDELHIGRVFSADLYATPEEAAKGARDLMLYGTAFVTRDGRRIRPQDVRPPTDCEKEKR